MTHKDIYTKFMIEYDKANVTSSYPSLTEYEVATVLDKAYNALIAQKVTGNNLRRVPLEGDLKSIEDLAPLVTNDIQDITYHPGINILSCDVPNILGNTMLYFVSGFLKQTLENEYVYGNDIDVTIEPVIVPTGGWFAYMIPTYSKGRLFYDGDPNPDKLFWYRFYHHVDITDVASNTYKYEPIGEWAAGTLGDISKLLSTNTITVDNVEKFVNYIAIIPGKNDMNDLEYVSNNRILLTAKRVLEQKVKPYDQINPRRLPIKLVNHEIADKFVTTTYNMPWIKIPVCYIEDGKMYIVYDPINTPDYVRVWLTYIRQPNKFVKDLNSWPFNQAVTSGISYFQYEGSDEDIKKFYEFECNDTVAEELISLAISFALENIESTRLNSKLNMRGLEA